MILQMLISPDHYNSCWLRHPCFGPSRHDTPSYSLVWYSSQSRWLHSDLTTVISYRCLTILMVWLITQVVDKTCREGFHLLWCRSHFLNYMSVMHYHQMTLSNFFDLEESWSVSEGLCLRFTEQSLHWKDCLTDCWCYSRECCRLSNE